MQNNGKTNLIARLMKLFMKKPAICGMENIDPGTAAIFVSNHLGYYAPVKLLVYSGIKMVPWVAHELTERKSCRVYLKTAFIEPQLHLKGILGSILAAAITPLCIILMKYIGAVPVYRKSRRVKITIDRTIDNLEKSNHILIFPEIADQPLNEFLCRLDPGFVNLSRLYYERHGRNTVFYPVCVNRKANRISFGKSITFNPELPFNLEKKRILSELTDGIIAMYSAELL